jgi:hypothetical protein
VGFDGIIGVDNDLNIMLDPSDQIMHIVVKKKKRPKAGEGEGRGNDANQGAGLMGPETHKRFSEKVP